MSARARRGVKRVVASLAMEVVLEGVRGYLGEQLKPVTPEHLYQAIKEDADPWEHVPARVRRKGSIWARKLRRYQDRLTPELVLEWLKKDRPELGSLIENMGAEGKKWLAKWTERIKERLWPPEPRLKLVPKEMFEAEEEPEQPEETPPKIKWV